MSLYRGMDTENDLHLHSGVLHMCKNNDFMKFTGKWMELENIMLTGVTQSKNVHTWNALTDKWIIVHNLTIPKYQFTNKMTLQKEDQSVDASVLSGRGNKIIMRDKVWSTH